MSATSQRAPISLHKYFDLIQMKATLNKTASNYFVFESQMRIPTGLWWRSDGAAAETHFLRPPRPSPPCAPKARYPPKIQRQ